MTGPAGPARDGYDSALSPIRNHIEDLASQITAWEARKEPDAHARRAANSAIDAIDTSLQALLALRQSLVSEIHQADEANTARVDALLAGRARDQELSEAIRPENTEGRALGTPGPAKGNADEQQE